MGFNLNDYETVESRIEKFWEKYPTGAIRTELKEASDNRFIVKAYIFTNIEADKALATGYAEEIVGSTHINKTSALENCETSAIGRALANAGFATKGKRPSREEMSKAQPDTRTATLTPEKIYEQALNADLTTLRKLYTYAANHNLLTATVDENLLLGDAIQQLAQKLS